MTHERKNGILVQRKEEKKYATRLFCTAFHTPSKYIIDLNFIFCSLLCPALTSFDRHCFLWSDGNMLCSSAIEKAGDQQTKQKDNLFRHKMIGKKFMLSNLFLN